MDKYLSNLGTGCIKHSKSYLQVLCDLLEEPISQKNQMLTEVAINSLNAFLIAIWIVIEENFDKCFLSLLKLSNNLNESDLSDQMKKKLIKQVCDCISTLKKANKDVYKLFAQTILKSQCKSQLNNSVIDILYT